MATHTMSGIPGVGDVAWGDHICLFYGASDELGESLVPFIKAGLDSREQCIWITPEASCTKEVRRGLGSAIPNLGALEESCQVMIFDQETWSGRGCGGVATSWIEREEQALKQGYTGLRVVSQGDNAARQAPCQERSDCEGTLSAAIKGRRIVSLCGYRLSGVSNEDILDVISRHSYVLAKRSGGWRRVESESMRSARQELRRMSQIAEFREQFLGVVSHDLRNPLNSIMLAAYTLMRSESEFDTAVRRKLHGRIVSSTQRMAQLVTDLLDFTRVRMGRGLPIEFAPADINGICRTVCEELEWAHPGRRMELQLDALGPGMWDRARLVQGISNIVGNALQYSPVDSSVTVRTRNAYAGSSRELHGEGLFVEVHNWGDPIPEDLMPRLFDPFHRSAQSQPSSGLGLGLFIAEQIISAHRGQVRVSSSSEDGVRFTIYLPRDPQRVARRDDAQVTSVG